MESVSDEENRLFHCVIFLQVEHDPILPWEQTTVHRVFIYLCNVHFIFFAFSSVFSQGASSANSAFEISRAWASDLSHSLSMEIEFPPMSAHRLSNEDPSTDRC
jgi:hypothetical protein